MWGLKNKDRNQHMVPIIGGFMIGKVTLMYMPYQMTSMEI